MHETGLIRTDMFGQVGQERYHVMLGCSFDFVDAGHVEFNVFGLPNGVRVFTWDYTDVGHSFAGVRFDFVPDFEFGCRGPNGHHIRTGIARDHNAHLFVSVHGIAVPLNGM